MSPELWCPFAVRRDAPAWKQGYTGATVNLLEGIVDHSAEGPLSACFSVLDSQHRYASWWATVAKDGAIYQHYPLTAVTWHAGGLEANRRFVGIEHEGRVGEPLTDRQYEATLRLHIWLWPQMGLGEPERQVNLWEHREMTRFGSPATACPSGRIPWDRLIPALRGATMKCLTPKEALTFNAQVAYLLNRERDMGKVADVLRYIFKAKGWAWPTL